MLCLSFDRYSIFCQSAYHVITANVIYFVQLKQNDISQKYFEGSLSSIPNVTLFQQHRNSIEYYIAKIIKSIQQGKFIKRIPLFIKYEIIIIKQMRSSIIKQINKSGGKGIAKFSHIEDIRYYDLFMPNHRNSIFTLDEA